MANERLQKLGVSNQHYFGFREGSERKANLPHVDGKVLLWAAHLSIAGVHWPAVGPSVPVWPWPYDNLNGLLRAGTYRQYLINKLIRIVNQTSRERVSHLLILARIENIWPSARPRTNRLDSPFLAGSSSTKKKLYGWYNVENASLAEALSQCFKVFVWSMDDDRFAAMRFVGVRVISVKPHQPLVPEYPEKPKHS